MQGSNLRPPACKADALPAELILHIYGDPYGIRTRVTAVKGRCLNHLTNGPDLGQAKFNAFYYIQEQTKMQTLTAISLFSVFIFYFRWKNKKDKNP
jgi:hypothetical protein